MKIICILQNAWGDRELPIVFRPNPNNKSAKTIRKKLLEEHDVMHFTNTTPVVTSTASGRANIDEEHFSKVILQLTKYDIILVCGTQAKKAVDSRFKEIENLLIPLIIMPHPASRSLSNVQLSSIKEEITKIRSLDKKEEERIELYNKLK